MEPPGPNFDNRTSQSLTQGRTGRLCPTCSLHVSDDMKVCPNDGTSLALAGAPKITSNLAGQYEFISKIGEGGMGIIYKARHIALNQMVAIKMMHINGLNDAKVLRFQQEAKAVSSLDHPSIVRVRDFGISESGQPHMVLDFIDGVTLEQFIKTHGPLSIRDAKDLFVQICDAVAHAHARNVLHRDLKPSNIMMVYRENDCPLVKIVDFGIAKITDPEQGMSLTRTGEVFGSPFYMSPEQTAGKPLDKRSDVYSVGCVLFEALTGTPPFVGQNAIETLIKHTSEAPPSLQEASLGKVFPPELQAVLDKALAKDLNARYQDMTEFRNALTNAFNSLGRPIAAKVEDSKKKKAFSPTQWVLVVGACSVVFMALLAAAYINSRKNEPAQIPADHPAQVGASDTVVPPSDIEKPPSMADTIYDPDLVARASILKHKDDDTISVQLWCTDKALDAFDEVKNARIVSLENTAIEGPGLMHLVKLPLEELSLSGGGSLRDSATDAIIFMKKLRVLDLYQTKIDDIALESLPALRELQNLNVGYTGVTGQGLIYLEPVKSLHSLGLSHCPRIEDRDMKALRGFPQLSALNLDGVDIGNEGVRILSGGRLVPPLTDLNLGKTKITDDGIKCLRAFPDLDRLSIDGTAVTKAGLQSLAATNKKLKTLNLEKCTHIHDQDLLVLRELPLLDNLNLDSSDIGHAGVRALVSLPLTDLNLTKTTITDEDLLTLAKIRTLKQLNLNGVTTLTNAGVSEFNRLLPDCKTSQQNPRAGRWHGGHGHGHGGGGGIGAGLKRFFGETHPGVEQRVHER